MENYIELYYDDIKRESIKKYHKIKYQQLYFIFENREEVLKTKPLEAIKSLALTFYGTMPKLTPESYYKYFNKFKPYLEKNDYLRLLKESLKNKDFINKPSCKVFNASYLDIDMLEYLENNSLFKFSSSMGDFVIYYHLNCSVPDYAQELKFDPLGDTQYLKSYWNYLKKEQQDALYKELGMDIRIN